MWGEKPYLVEVREKDVTTGWHPVDSLEVATWVIPAAGPRCSSCSGDTTSRSASGATRPAPLKGPCDWFPSCKDKGYLYEYENLLGRRVRHFFVTSSLPPCATPRSSRRLCSNLYLDLPSRLLDRAQRGGQRGPIQGLQVLVGGAAMSQDVPPSLEQAHASLQSFAQYGPSYWPCARYFTLASLDAEGETDGGSAEVCR
jgi:hypothetical protein